MLYYKIYFIFLIVATFLAVTYFDLIFWSVYSCKYEQSEFR